MLETEEHVRITTEFLEVDFSGPSFLIPILVSVSTLGPVRINFLLMILIQHIYSLDQEHHSTRKAVSEA